MMTKWMAIVAVAFMLLVGVIAVSAQQDSAQTIGAYPHVGKACEVHFEATGIDTLSGTILQQNAEYLTLTVNENKDVVWVNVGQIAYVKVVGMGPAAPVR
ncbi:MAG: hypothetical protein IT366_13385 [Candidatus Hydrogenedentes bacterium]|nr:hypothetical protein [Candidatus Hydrogenedentota bacterium]